LKISVHEAENLSLEAIGRFVEASEGIRFESVNRHQLYCWVERLLVQHEYALQGKATRGLVRRYIAKMTGLSRAQLTRLIARYTASGRVQPAVYHRHSFAGRYTRVDIELLATLDEAHKTLCGPATQRTLEHESSLLICTTCAAASATASRAGTPSRHLSRRSRSGSSASLSRRASPAICAWIRCISAISRGDPGSKGVDHIHALDIGAAHLGGLSGFINATMSKLLDKPLIEQGKSHPPVKRGQRAD
jgi:hypothetical protein